MSGFDESGRGREVDEAALVARVRGGDREALGELYQRFRPRVAGYLARRMQACPADVEDVVQETFIRLPELAGSFDPATHEVGAWLCGRVARWTLVDHRRNDRFGQLSAVEVARDSARLAPTETAEERESRPLSVRMVTALARLTPAQRMSMQLRYLEGLPARAAAAVAGSSSASILQNCMTARRRLRTELADLAPALEPSWSDGLSKKELAEAAFEAVGARDVAAARSWLAAHGARVSDRYLQALRAGTQDSPTAVATTGSVPTARHPADRSGVADGVSKKELVEAAFEAVGARDVTAARSWLAERGLQVSRRYVYQLGEAEQTATVTLPPPIPSPRTEAGPDAAATGIEGSLPGAAPRDETKPRGERAEPAGPGDAAPRTGDQAGDRAGVEGRGHRAVVDRARRAVAHATRRLAEQAAGEEPARAEQLTRWHADDQAAQAEDTTRAADDRAGDSYGLAGAGR